MASVRHAKIVSLLNQKGGVGKTTLTFNLAHAFASKGAKVLCLDMDPQANLSLLFNIDIDQENQHSEIFKPTVFQLLVNSVRELKRLHKPFLFSEVIRKGRTSTIGEIDVLPAGQDLSGFELTMAGLNAPRQLILQKMINDFGLRELYDYILIDGPPTLGLIVVNILCACDGVLIPFQPDQFSRKGLGHFHDVLLDVADMGIVKAPKILGHIPNLVEARRKGSGLNVELIKGDLEESGENVHKIFEGLANKAQISRAVSEKKSVFDYGAKDFDELKLKFLQISQYVEEGL